MPEGDTVHKLAAALRPDLQGRSLELLWLRGRAGLGALAGRTVVSVEALGKHLLVGIAREGAATPTRRGAERPGHVLHVHLGMRGRWHRTRPGERWTRPPAAASLRLACGGLEHACFRPAVAELLRGVDLALHPVLSRLGPDLLGAELPLERIVARARRLEPRSASDLLLDQRVACGIGNVYKSEVLFLRAVHPSAPVDALDDATLTGLYADAARLLAGNLGPWRRTTLRPVQPGSEPRRGEPRLWVYGRAGRPCRRCGAPVASARLGDDARPIFWCPDCQPRVRRRPAGLHEAPRASGPTGSSA